MKTQLLVLISAALVAPLSGVAAYAISNSTPPLIMKGPAVQPKPKSADQVSPTAAEVIKLSKSKVGDEVIISYIENTVATYDLTSENIIYLHDTGLKPQVIAAMIKHDKLRYDQLAVENARAATNRPPNMDRTESEQMQPYPYPYEQGPQEIPPQSQNYYDNGYGYGYGGAGYYYGSFAPFGSGFNLCDDACGFEPLSPFSFSHRLGDWDDFFQFRHGRRDFDPGFRDPSVFTFSHHLGDWEDVFRFRHDRRDFNPRLRDFTFIHNRNLGRPFVVNNFAAGSQHTFVNRGTGITRVSMSQNPIPRANAQAGQLNATGTRGGRSSRIIGTVPKGVQFGAPVASATAAGNSGNGAAMGGGGSGRAK
jgi:hypothetical protein